MKVDVVPVTYLQGNQVKSVMFMEVVRTRLSVMSVGDSLNEKALLYG